MQKKPPDPRTSIASVRLDPLLEKQLREMADNADTGFSEIIRTAITLMHMALKGETGIHAAMIKLHNNHVQNVAVLTKAGKGKRP